MIEISHLLQLADEYQRVTGASDTTLSFWVFRDSKKLAALRGKADITTKRFQGAVRWFSEHWPEGADWPASIERAA